jgi:hypothetical protein
MSEAPANANGSNRTVAALRGLATELERTRTELKRLTDRAEKLARRVETGNPLGAAMAAEERPLIITQLVDITDRLHEVGGEVRRAEAEQLVAEGYTQDRIAAEFGVTRQRVGALLRPVPAERNGPKRPKRGQPPSNR